jgi:hypothetical protein
VLRSTFFPPELFGGTKLFLSWIPRKGGKGAYRVHSRFMDYYTSMPVTEGTAEARRSYDEAVGQFESLLIGR